MTPPGDEFDAFPFPAATARDLDRMCLEFESAWRRGETPALAEFVNRVPPEARGVGAELLVEIEVDALRERGESPELERYEALLVGTQDVHAWWKRVVATAPAAPNANARPVPLPDRFELLEELGSGGMGDVYKARHRHLGRVVAVKVLRRRLAGNDEAMSRFRNEVRALAELDHPQVAAAIDADFVDGYGVLVLEYVEGMDLQRRVRKEGPLEVSEALRIGRELAGALRYAHERGIVHRDVKPSNVMRTPSGQIKLLDLGTAELMPAGRAAGAPVEVREFVGTPEFASPEQGSGGTVDGRSDVYALGCTLFFLLTGRPPYQGDSPLATLAAHRSAPLPSLRTERPEVSGGFERLLRRLLAKQPHERPGMDEALRRFEQLAGEERARRAKWARRGLLVAVIAAAAFVGAASLQLRSSPHPPVRMQIANSIGMELAEVVLPPPDTIESDSSRRLLVGVREVTRRQFQLVMGQSGPAESDSDAPATDVTWLEAEDFCRRLSERADERIAVRRYRLPTESEWLAIAKADSETSTHGVTGLLEGPWEWCDVSSANEPSGPETALGEGLPFRTQRPVLGPAGLFLHNFDLWGDHRAHLAESDGVRLREESEGRTRYFEPAAPRRDGRLVYAYEFPSPIVEASLFAKILAHRPTSAASLEVSADGHSWTVVDEGYVHNSHEAPRDVTRWVAGSRRIDVRLRVREDSEMTWQSQALRTSPNPELQFPNVYQLLVVTEPSRTLPDGQVLAPITLRHARLGFRIVCDNGPGRANQPP